MKERNKFIDFQKFIFSVFIALYHFVPFNNSIISNYFSNAYILVDFFFIVSGFFIAEKAFNYSGNNLYDYNIYLIYKRFKNIFPYVLTAVLLSISFYAFKSDYLFYLDGLFKSYVDVFGLQMFGFKGFYAIGTAWFLSALYICSFIVFPILVKNFEKYSKCISPVLSLLLLGFLCIMDGNMEYPANWHLLYSGLIRAFADISLGSTSFILCMYINKKANNNILILRTVEISILVFSSIYAVFSNLKNYYDFIFPVLFCISVAISNSDISIGNVIFRNKVFNILGLFSLSIFLNHRYIAVNLSSYFSNYSSVNILFIYLLLVFICSLINFIVGRLLLNIKTRKITAYIVVFVYFAIWISSYYYQLFISV